MPFIKDDLLASGVHQDRTGLWRLPELCASSQTVRRRSKGRQEESRNIQIVLERPFAQAYDVVVATAAQQIIEDVYRESHNYSEGKLVALIARLVQICDPVCIYAFGSRAKGSPREDSDLDIAIVVDQMDKAHPRPPVYLAREGLRMTVDLVVFSTDSFRQVRPWPGTIENEVYTHGIKIYDRAHSQSANRQTLAAFAGR